MSSPKPHFSRKACRPGRATETSSDGGASSGAVLPEMIPNGTAHRAGWILAARQGEDPDHRIDNSDLRNEEYAIARIPLGDESHRKPRIGPFVADHHMTMMPSGDRALNRVIQHETSVYVSS